MPRNASRKLKHKDPSVRIEAIKKLDDQEKLAEIAKNDSNRDVREAAVEKINDESVLAWVAKYDDTYDVRKVAVERISDESILAGIVINFEKYYPVGRLEKQGGL